MRRLLAWLRRILGYSAFFRGQEVHPDLLRLYRTKTTAQFYADAQAGKLQYVKGRWVKRC